MTKREPLRMVVGVGRGGDTSAVALRQALLLASGSPSELHVALALSDPESDLERLRRRMLDSEAWLAEYVAWGIGQWIEPPLRFDLVYHVRIGEPARVLTQIAFDVGASCIVVGAHPRSRVATLLSGGVAASLFVEGRYPLIVARVPDEAGLEKTPRPEPRRPGEPLRTSREQVLESSDRVDYALPAPHVSGLL